MGLNRLLKRLAHDTSGAACTGSEGRARLAREGGGANKHPPPPPPGKVNNRGGVRQKSRFPRAGIDQKLTKNTGLYLCHYGFFFLK